MHSAPQPGAARLSRHRVDDTPHLSFPGRVGVSSTSTVERAPHPRWQRCCGASSTPSAITDRTGCPAVAAKARSASMPRQSGRPRHVRRMPSAGNSAPGRPHHLTGSHRIPSTESAHYTNRAAAAVEPDSAANSAPGRPHHLTGSHRIPSTESGHRTHRAAAAVEPDSAARANYCAESRSALSVRASPRYT
jgi:hypothetical protein